MDRPRPACPICGATDERPPDGLGVHRCSACAIEFRPRGRMPIRRAGVTTAIQPNSDAAAWTVALVIVGVLVGLATAAGDHQASTPPSFEPPPITLQPIVVDPALFEGLDKFELANPLAVPLTHELHRSQISEGRLLATGLITAPGSQAVDEITVEVSSRDLSGTPLPILHAVVSCETMSPGEVCAWMIDAEVPSTTAELEIDAVARLSLGLGPPRFDLRSDRADELDFDAKHELVKFRTRERSVLGAWATVTAYDAQQRVLGVSKTHWPDRLTAGRHRLKVAVPESAEHVGRYDVRVGGLVPDW